MSRLRIYVILLICVLLSGCSGSSDSSGLESPSVSTGLSQSASPSATSSAPVGSVELHQVLGRAVPSRVSRQRFTGFSAAETVLYGPVTQDTVEVILLEEVPVEVTRLQIEYLLPSGEVMGLGSVPVEVRPGETTAITDPPFLDLVEALEELQLSPRTDTIASGTTRTFAATGTFPDGSTANLSSSVSWFSSDESVATVSSTGLAMAVSPGEATVTADYGDFRATALLTVTSATVTSLAVTSPNLSVAEGTSEQLTATATFSDGTTQNVTQFASWISSETGVATVQTAGDSNPGLANAVSQGRVTMGATFGSVTGSKELSITGATISSLAIEPPEALSAPGTQRRYQAIATYSDGSTQDITSLASWTVTGNSGVSISDSSVGVLEKGEATIDTEATLGTPAVVEASYESLSQTSELRVNRFAYVISQASNQVFAFGIGDDGTPTQAGQYPLSGDGAVVSVVDPSGRYLYVTSYLSNDISAYGIGNDGSLTEISGSPFPSGSYQPLALSVSANGRFLFAAGYNDTAVYSVGHDGALTEISGSPFSTSAVAVLALDPTGRYVYAAYDRLSGYSIGADGGLTELSSSPFAGSGQLSVAVHPSDPFVYASTPASGVRGYRAGDDGALTELSGSPFPADIASGSIAVEPSGRYAYVANGRGVILGYHIGTDGGLSALPDSPFASGGVPYVLRVESGGRYVFAAYGTNKFRIFTVEGDGSLTEIAGSPFGAGGKSYDIALTP